MPVRHRAIDYTLEFVTDVLARAGVVLSPALGAALMAGSTVVVAVNARLLRAPSR